MTHLTPAELATIRTLVSLAKLTYTALDDSEEYEGNDGRCHCISAQDFDDVEGALDVLDELPDDRPGYTLAPGGKAEWALRRLLAPRTFATQSVNTAPKDGTAVLMWFEGSDIPHSVRWANDGWHMTWDGELRTEPVAWMDIPDLAASTPADKQLADALDSLAFYRRRCELLQSLQSKMRDPERTIVCDVLANGQLLRGPDGKPDAGRYAHAAPDDLAARLMAAARRDALTWEDRKAIGEAIGHIEIARLMAPQAAPQPAAQHGESSIRAALAELVAVKDLKEETEAIHFAGLSGRHGENWEAVYDTGRREYLRRQPAAWDAARAALATQTQDAAPVAQGDVVNEALRCAAWLEHIAAGGEVVEVDGLAGTSAAELRRLSAMVDELRELLQDAKRAMTELHQAAIPDESTEGVPAIIPPEAFRKFVDAHALLCFCLHQRGHNPPQEAQRHG